MIAFMTQPKLLLPRSRQFPFDEVVERIVEAVRARNWQVPGIEIKYGVYGEGAEKYCKVQQIIGEDFMLYFSRAQGEAGKWFDTAAVSELFIPRQELHVYVDESGPMYTVYVGDDWDADKKNFMNSIKVHPKMNNKPRKYLTYSGDGHARRARFLTADNDLGRAYSPSGSEPTEYSTDSVFDGFKRWLKENVLEYILSFPEAKVVDFPISKEELMEYSGACLYTVCTQSEAERIMQGKEDELSLEEAERYAAIGRGVRLLSLGVPNDGSVPDVAYEGFIWCGIGEVSDKTTREEISPPIIDWSDVDYLVRISPTYSNHIFVFDHSAYDEVREAVIAKTEAGTGETDEGRRNQLTVEGAHEVARAGARTLIPIDRYEGNYKNPIALINRELDFCEVEIVKSLKEKERENE